MAAALAGGKAKKKVRLSIFISHYACTPCPRFILMGKILCTTPHNPIRISRSGTRAN
jgi:hypothetical protein